MINIFSKKLLYFLKFILFCEILENIINIIIINNKIIYQLF